MKCDICDRESDELTALPDVTEGVLADDAMVCPSCLVAGVAEGHVHLNPAALEQQDDDNEGEEWKE